MMATFVLGVLEADDIPETRLVFVWVEVPESPELVVESVPEVVEDEEVVEGVEDDVGVVDADVLVEGEVDVDVEVSVAEVSVAEELSVAEVAVWLVEVSVGGGVDARVWLGVVWLAVAWAAAD